MFKRKKHGGFCLKNENQNITELFSLNTSPDILLVAHRTDNTYQAYVGERILDKIKTIDHEKLCRLSDEYNVHCRTNRDGCFYIATLELERPKTTISTEQFIMDISNNFIGFREALPKILGGVRTKKLTAAEIYEVFTGFPKETMISF
jgi:hypothetical protein